MSAALGRPEAPRGLVQLVRAESSTADAASGREVPSRSTRLP